MDAHAIIWQRQHWARTLITPLLLNLVRGFLKAQSNNTTTDYPTKKPQDKNLEAFFIVT